MTRPLRSTDPSRIGDYELIGRIGGGGMGDVFLGRSPGGRLAAVKVVRDLLADEPRFRERFRREVAAARKVGGAYTAPVLDADPDAERPWLATAYIDGPSLADKVENGGPLAADDVRRLGAGLAEALRDIHRAGLVHRDLKPGNVLLAQDGPRLIDFGIIRAEDGAGLTETGFVLGSAGYMAPEQAAGGEATKAADVYALGAVLAFAATGEGPFGSGAAPAVLLRQASATPDIADVPEGLRDVIARCLDRGPEARPSTTELLTLLGGEAGELPKQISTKSKTKSKTKTKSKPRPKDAPLVHERDLDTDIDHVIAATPTTVMPLEKAKRKSKPQPRSRKYTPPPSANPTRRNFLILGVLGASAAGIALGVAKMPGGDTKPTGGEVGDDSGAATGSTLPTNRTKGRLGGPIKAPLWTKTVPGRADILTTVDGTLLVAGSSLTAFDGATGVQHWAANQGTYNDLYQGYLPVNGGTVYELTNAYGDLAALSAKDGSQSWTVKAPTDWLPDGLVGASDDIVVLWSSPKSGAPGGVGLWAADPRTRQQAWTTPVDAFDGLPYFSQGTSHVLTSHPNDFRLTAYDARTGHPAWTAEDLVDHNQDRPIATAITSYGETVYWAASRLYALDGNGRHRWPSGVSEGGSSGAFHAVVADDKTVYAAANQTLGEDVIAAFTASDGAPLWRSAWPSGLYISPSLECKMALGAGNVYIVEHSTGTLLALDAATGETLWQFHDKGTQSSEDWHVAADDKYVYICYGNTVHAFTAAAI